MAYPKWLKKGGGAFTGDGSIVLSFLIGEKKADRNGNDFQPVSLVVAFKKDGADEAVTKRLLVGNGAGAEFSLAEDGKVLVAPDGIMMNQEGGQFIQSLLDGGFPVSKFGDDDTRIDVRGADGYRVSLSNDVDVEATKARGQETGADGKKYDRRKLLVAKVYGEGSGGVSATKDTAAKKGQPATTAAKPAATSSADIDAGATALLVEALQGNDGVLAKKEIVTKVTQKANKDKYGADFVKVRARAYSDAFLQKLNAEGVIAYDPANVEQTVILAAVPA